MDIHSHKCPKCFRIWTHDRDKIGYSFTEYQTAHTCRNCGTIIYFKHFESPEDELIQILQAFQRLF